MTTDDHWMRRAIRLAMNGRGRVEPNPMVGCVIVKNDRLIGEGYHEQFGGPHAEPNALAHCTESPAGATVYTTLEPCCHTNKKTPPCVPRLIEAKVARVVIGCFDPNPQVNGQGVQALRHAGIVVDCPVAEPQAKQLLAPFAARTLHRRPYVTLKWAETADAKVGAEAGRVLISNPASTAVVHQLRARCDAIMVSARTVIADDPLLTARGVPPVRPLLRVVIDRNLRIGLHSRLLHDAAGGPVRIYTDAPTFERYHTTVIAELQRRGVDVRSADGIRSILRDLADTGVTHALVEAGPRLARGWLGHEPTDRLWVIRSPRPFGEGGLASAGVPADYVRTGELNIVGDTLTEYLNPASPVFFAPEPSADLVFAAESGSPDGILPGGATPRA